MTTRTPAAAHRARLIPALALILALAVFAVPACKKNSGKNAAGKNAAEKGKKTPPPKDAIVSLKKNGEYITLNEVNTAWDKELPDQNKFAIRNSKENWRQQFLDQWIDVSVLAELARRKGLDKTQEFKTQIAVKEKSLLGGIYYRDFILPELEKVTVEDADLDKFYEENKDEMFFIGWREVKHIVVNSAEVARQLAEELKKNPAGFAAAARQNSIDGDTAGSGGALGRVFKGDERIPPEAESVYLFTPAGQVGGPAQSSRGWHIVYVTDASLPEMDYKPLDDELRARIKQLARIRKMEEQYDRILAEYKNEMDIKVENGMVPDIASDWERKMDQMMPTFQQPPAQ
jgi:hypothetical protein